MDNYNIDTELYILGCILNNYSGTYSIGALERFIKAEDEFNSLKGIPDEYLLDEVEEALIDNLFVSVRLEREGARQRCLEWVEMRKKGQNPQEPIDENIFRKHGLEAFRYLEKKFPKKEPNGEWYSAIYRFLANKALADGVVAYQNYILKSGRLKSFSRVTATCTIDGKLDEKNIYISALQKHYERFQKLKDQSNMKD